MDGDEVVVTVGAQSLLALLDRLGEAGLRHLPESLAILRLVRQPEFDFLAALEVLDSLESTLTEHPAAWVADGAAFALDLAYDQLTSDAERARTEALRSLERALDELHSVARHEGRGRATAARRVGALRASVREDPCDDAVLGRLERAVDELWRQMPVDGGFPDRPDRLRCAAATSLSRLRRVADFAARRRAARRRGVG